MNHMLYLAVGYLSFVAGVMLDAHRTIAFLLIIPISFCGLTLVHRANKAKNL